MPAHNLNSPKSVWSWNPGVENRAWRIFLIAGCLVLPFYFIFPSAGVESVLWVGIGTVTTFAAAIGLRAYRPHPIAAWTLLVVGQVFSAIGSAFYACQYYLDVVVLPAGIENGFFSIGIVCYFTGFGVLFVTFRRLLRGESITHGLVLATGLASLIWVVEITPNLLKSPQPAEWLEVEGYPVGLLALVAVVSLFLMTSLGRLWCYRLLFGSVILYVPALFFNSEFLSHPPPNGIWSSNGISILSDFSLSASNLLLAVVFLHPSMLALRNALPNKESLISRQDLLVLGIAFVAAPAVSIVQRLRGAPVDEGPVLLGMCVIFCLVEARLALLVRVLESQNRQLSHQQAQLHHQAFHDALTGLPNRSFSIRHLSEALERARLTGSLGAVFMIDLDNFKQVNDTLGHDRGDVALREIAGQLALLKRRDDMVARWGGDEFLFILEDLRNAEAAIAVARRLSQEVVLSVEGGGQTFKVTASIGICLFPNGHDDIQSIIRTADSALYRAKASDKERIALGLDSIPAMN